MATNHPNHPNHPKMEAINLRGTTIPVCGRLRVDHSLP